MSAIPNDTTAQTNKPKKVSSILEYAPKSKKPSFLQTQKDRYQEILTSINRRNVNKKIASQPTLRFLPTDHIIYDNAVFVQYDERTIAQLRSMGFLREEGRCRFQQSYYTLFWKEFMLEFEIVKSENWPMLKTCVDLSNLTGYYNLNKICDTLLQTGV